MNNILNDTDFHDYRIIGLTQDHQFHYFLSLPDGFHILVVDKNQTGEVPQVGDKIRIYHKSEMHDTRGVVLLQYAKETNGFRFVVFWYEIQEEHDRKMSEFYHEKRINGLM